MRGRFNVIGLWEAAKGKPELEKKFHAELSEAIDAGEVKANEFSFRELFEGLVEDGRTIVSQWSNNPESRMSLLEAGVQTSNFSNITGQLMVNEVMAGFNDVSFIGDQLCRTMTTRLARGEKVIGLAGVGSGSIEVVGEGQPYPFAGFGEDWVQTPETAKRGTIVQITREAIVADLTGQILDRARGVGYATGYDREVRILDAALGITSTYNRKNLGVVATYGDNSGAHDFDNLAASNTLVDWTDIENAELLFDAMVDPNTGDAINVIPNTLVVPTSLKYTARRILDATGIQFGDGASNTTRTIGSNPVGGAYSLVSSPLVRARTSSTTTWFIGDFKKAFRYMEVSPMQVVEAPTNATEEFHRDIVNQYKVSEWGVAACVEPRFVVKCT